MKSGCPLAKSAKNRSCRAEARPLQRGNAKAPQVRIARLLSEAFPEHRSAAFGRFSCSFVLQDIPVLDEHTIFDPQDVRGDPVGRATHAGKTPMDDYKVILRHDRAMFVFQGWRGCLD